MKRLAILAAAWLATAASPAPSPTAPATPTDAPAAAAPATPPAANAPAAANPASPPAAHHAPAHAPARGGARTPAARTPAAPAAATPVVLAPRPGSVLDRAARALSRQDLAEAARSGEVPLVLVGSASLNQSDRPALFVQLQSPRECGSAGCSTTVYLWRAGVYSRILDGVGGKIGVAATRTGGMADLVSDSTRYVWDGKVYKDINPAPALNLTPRR